MQETCLSSYTCARHASLGHHILEDEHRACILFLRNVKVPVSKQAHVMKPWHKSDASFVFPGEAVAELACALSWRVVLHPKDQHAIMAYKHVQLPSTSVSSDAWHESMLTRCMAREHADTMHGTRAC
jgi:hypothetical protein